MVVFVYVYVGEVMKVDGCVLVDGELFGFV